MDVEVVEAVSGDELEGIPPTLIEVEVVEATPKVAPPALPLVTIEEEVQVAEFLMLALPVELAIIEVVEEVEPDAARLSVIKAIPEVLLAIIELPIGKVVGEVIGKVIVGEVVCEATISTYEVTMTLAVASPEVGHVAGLLPMLTMGINSQLHGSPPRASQMPNLLLGQLTASPSAYR